MTSAAMRLTFAFLLVGAALALVACGGESEPASAPPAATRAEVPPPAAETEPAAPPEPEAPPASEPAPEPQPEPPPPEALPGLPRFTAGYRDWLKLNEEPIPPRQDSDAHLGTKDVYASAVRNASGVYPSGAIIVKEAVRPGADFIGLVAIMRKERGADPEHGDWVFVEYTRSGPNERFSPTAADSVCWSCHMGAVETDWVWIHTLGIVP